MSAAVTTQQRSHVTVEARIFPACLCGAPWPAHRAEATGCCAYQPRRPVEDRGLIAYTHPNVLCRWLFAIEDWCRGRRQQLEQRGAK